MNRQVDENSSKTRSNLFLIKGTLLLFAAALVATNGFGCEREKEIKPFKQTTQKLLVFNEQNKMSV